MKRYQRFARLKSIDPDRDEWYTPRALTLSLGEFDLDPCAGPKTRHARINWKKERDGFNREWLGRIWLNPPFLERRRWSEKLAGHRNGILLLNAAGLEARWFQEVIGAADGFLLTHRRIEFERLNHPDCQPPSGQILIAFGKRNLRALLNCGLSGIAFGPCLRGLRPRRENPLHE